MSKLQAVVESHSECLKKSQAVFEDQEETIHTILNDSVKKNEIFEDNSYKMKYAQESLEKQTNKKFQDLENKVRTYENGSGDFKRELEKASKEIVLVINHNIILSGKSPGQQEPLYLNSRSNLGSCLPLLLGAHLDCHAS